MSDESISYEVTSPTMNGHKPLTRLSALDKLFDATGEVTLKCGKHDVTLPIQAVDLELVDTLCRPYRPKPKISVAMVNGRRETTAHVAEDEYQTALTAYNRLSSQVYVLCALLCDIEDKQGKVVWSADNSVHDIEAAKQALKDMGLVDSQMVVILNAVQELTRGVEETQVGE